MLMSEEEKRMCLGRHTTILEVLRPLVSRIMRQIRLLTLRWRAPVCMLLYAVRAHEANAQRIVLYPGLIASYFTWHFQACIRQCYSTRHRPRPILKEDGKKHIA